MIDMLVDSTELEFYYKPQMTKKLAADFMEVVNNDFLTVKSGKKFFSLETLNRPSIN